MFGLQCGVVEKAPSSPRDALAQERHAVAVEIVECGDAPDGDQGECLGGAAHLRAGAARPVEVGGDESQPLRVPARERERIGVVEHEPQALRVDRSGQAERPADVLLVHEVVGESETVQRPLRRHPQEYPHHSIGVRAGRLGIGVGRRISPIA